MNASLHIGGDILVDADEIVFAVDRKNAIGSRDTRRAIDAAIGSKRIHAVPGGALRSYLVLGHGEFTVYALAVSTRTLLKRANAE